MRCATVNEVGEDGKVAVGGESKSCGARQDVRAPALGSEEMRTLRMRLTTRSATSVSRSKH